MKLIKTPLLLSKLFLVILLLSQTVYAARLTNLYTLNSLVSDTSDEQRAAVANTLLRELLVRVSGTERVLEKMPPTDFITAPDVFAKHPNFKLWTDLTSAQRLINQYSYNASSELLMTETGEKVSAQQLELTFDEGGVKQLLQQLQAPIWDINRPNVLFWVALEGRGGRTLITPASNQPLSNVLISQSSKRGIPYLLPDFTLHPVADSLFSDIWGGFTQQITAASAPYQPDAILVGKIRASGNQWRVEWQLMVGSTNIKHTVSVATLRDVLQEGVNFAAEKLSSRYASHAIQNTGTYKIMVDNVAKVQDYAAIMNNFNRLSLTSNVRVVQSTHQQVLFEMTLRGGLDQLRANLTLDSRLKEASFLGLQQATNDPAAALQNNNATVEQADAYFYWQSN